ncbi:molybdenum cofactor biosynthesis protein MoaE [bacterium]|nr:molybdenum cofactor biosynthesis protein MoaE [bacterium]
MNLANLIASIKSHPNYHEAGMILCHNGVVRSTSRDGRKVSGLRVAVDHKKLKEVITTNKNRNGIIEILIEIAEEKDLNVGDDVMYIVVAGDIRENVIETLYNTLNDVKATVTSKTEYYV